MRLACIEMVHGAAGSAQELSSAKYWSPAAEGTDFDFSYTLEPLAPYRDYLTIVSNTDARRPTPSSPMKWAPTISAPAPCS